MPLTINSLWRYVGPGDGRGEVHCVIAVASDVITWSVPIYDNVTTCGHTWLGPVNEFYKQFKPL